MNGVRLWTVKNQEQAFVVFCLLEGYLPLVDALLGISECFITTRPSVGGRNGTRIDRGNSSCRGPLLENRACSKHKTRRTVFLCERVL